MRRSAGVSAHRITQQNDDAWSLELARPVPQAKRVDRHIHCPSQHRQKGVRGRLGPRLALGRWRNSLVSGTGRCKCLRVPENYFGDDVAVRYDESTRSMFDASVLAPTIDVLTELAGDGAA